MKARVVLGFLAGLLLVASAGAHAFLGWPPFQSLLEQAGVDADVTAALGVGWYFGSVAMLAFGVIVLHAALQALKGRRAPVGVLWIIAAAYTVYGLTVYVARDFNPHFLVFVVTGLLVGAVAALSRRRR
jgi:hypothetical protein